MELLKHFININQANNYSGSRGKNRQRSGKAGTQCRVSGNLGKFIVDQVGSSDWIKKAPMIASV
jgi:hypothetical protein